MICIEALLEKYVGFPFSEDFDCYDLVLAWFRDLGYDLPDYRSHEMYWRGEKIELADYFKFWRKIPEEEIEIHDGIFMESISPRRSKFHIGIYIGENKFIHSLDNKGVVINELRTYRKIIKGFYRLRMLEDAKQS